MSEFDGKVVLITGCGRVRGMGRAISVAFARAGADIVATDIATGGTRERERGGPRGDPPRLEGPREPGRRDRGPGSPRRDATVGDVSRAADAERFVAEALGRFGRVDVLVNNAAAPHGADRRLLWEVPEEAWDLVLDVNLKGAFLMSRARDSAHARAAQRADHQHGVGRRASAARRGAAPTRRRSSA